MLFLVRLMTIILLVRTFQFPVVAPSHSPAHLLVHICSLRYADRYRQKQAGVCPSLGLNVLQTDIQIDSWGYFGCVQGLVSTSLFTSSSFIDSACLLGERLSPYVALACVAMAITMVTQLS